MAACRASARATGVLVFMGLASLLMLVAAFAGMDNMRKAYAHAIRNQYRFFSYGDAMLIERAA